MRFGVLGPLAVWGDDGTVVPVPEPKVRTVLALLVLHVGRPVAADQLIDSLWTRRLPSDPSNALQTKVSTLRRTLSAGGGAADLIRLASDGYMLAVDPEHVDVVRFERLLALAAADPDPLTRVGVLATAVAIWRGQAVAELDDSVTARPVTARLEEARLVAIERLAEDRLELGEHREVVVDLAGQVIEHPHRERLCAAWMVALYRCGRHRDALAAYAALRARLADHFGLTPSPDLEALEAAILRHDPSLDGPGLSAGMAESTRAPRAPRAEIAEAADVELIGRADALAATIEQVRVAPLVTLVGPGGVGKTRLAAEAARRLARHEEWRVATVELARIAPAEQHDAGMAAVAESIAAVLNISTSRSTTSAMSEPVSLATRIGHAVSHRDTLVVLDNCEHVIDSVASVVEDLLRAAPGLRVLATSREPIRLRDEVVRDVPPLELPRTSDGPRDVADRPAVRLFAARGAQAVPGFQVDEANAAAVAEICRRLDGLPLAIELAAARLRALDVHDLARRLDDRFTLLGHAPRDLDERHRTLYAAIDWGWQLLDDDERALLRRLSVFPDRFDLDAGEAVGEGTGITRRAVAALLARLVDRSIVTRPDDEGLATISNRRPSGYRLPESIAAHARVQPSPDGEHDQARHNHRVFVTHLTARAAAGLRGADQRTWLCRMDDVNADIQAALTDAARDGDAACALQIVDASAWFWFLRGRIGESRRAMDQALAIPGGPAGLRARVTGWQIGFAALDGAARPLPPDEEIRQAFAGVDDPEGQALAEWFVGYTITGIDDPRSERLNESAHVRFAATSDTWGQAAAATASAWHAWQRGELRATRDAARDGAARFRALGDRWGELQANQMLELLAEVAGDYDAAAAISRTALRTAGDLGLPGDTSYALSRLGRITLLGGDAAAALNLHIEARNLAVEHHHVPLTQVADIGIALCHRRLDRLDDAENALRPWLHWNRQAANDAGIALIAAQLGFIADQRGDATLAHELHDEAHTAALATGDPRMLALALEGRAGAFALDGDHLQALELLASAASTRASVGATLPAAERFDLDRITARLVTTT